MLYAPQWVRTEPPAADLLALGAYRLVSHSHFIFSENIFFFSELFLDLCQIICIMRASCPTGRGGSRSSRNAGQVAVDAEVPITNGTIAYGEVVWS
jgi:hypothetical protein